jgi:hypothetical protein
VLEDDARKDWSFVASAPRWAKGQLAVHRRSRLRSLSWIYLGPYYSLMAWFALIVPLGVTEAFLPKRALALSGSCRPLRLPLLCVGVIAAAGPTALVFEVVYLRAGLMLGLLTIPLTTPVAIALLFWRISDWLFEEGGEGSGDSSDEPSPEPPWWPEFEKQLSRYAHQRAQEVGTNSAPAR